MMRDPFRPGPASTDDGPVSVQKATPYKGYAIPPQGTATLTTSKARTVDGEMAEAESLLNLLADELAALNDKLTPVTLPLMNGCGVAPLDDKAAAPAVARLMVINQRLSLAVSSLNELRGRLVV